MTLWGECERVCQSWTAGVVFQQKILCHHYITSTRDVSGLNCNARGRSDLTGYIPSRHGTSVLCHRLVGRQVTSNTAVAMCDIVQMYLVGFSIQIELAAVVLFTHCWAGLFSFRNLSA